MADISDKLHHWIDGADREPGTGRYLDVTDPATGQLTRHVADGDAEDVDAAVTAAAAALPRWRAIPALQRGRLLTDLGRANRADQCRLSGADRPTYAQCEFFAFSPNLDMDG